MGIKPKTFQIPVWQLDALTTELWGTGGEQGHILGSYMCDMCPAILQGTTWRNDKWIGIWKVMGSTPVGARLKNTSPLFTLYPSHQSIYYLQLVWQPLTIILNKYDANLKKSIQSGVFEFAMIMQCVVPEKIHAHPKEGLRKFQGGGGFKKPYFLKESMTLKWNFRRGGGGGGSN